MLAIANREVVAFDRNLATIELLQKAGVKVHLISSSEISKARGGPRCMSMPMWREFLPKQNQK